MPSILVVDDDPIALTLKKTILEQRGLAVTTCITTEEAVRKLRELKFDVVITDWRLGDERGRSVVIAAKENLTLPVVVVSGYVSEAFQAAEPRADLYLAKPADPQELYEVVTTLLRARTAGEDPS